jgi:Pregnancy-associated plasma protein-A
MGIPDYQSFDLDESYLRRKGSSMKGSILGGLATAAALALVGSAAPPTASARVPIDQTVGQRCEGSANARVMKGTSKWVDPNTLTRREAAVQQAEERRILARSGFRAGARPNGSVKIRVHFHGITDRAGHGFVSKRRFKRQIKVLNKAFSGHTGPKAVNTPFRFRLASIDRTKNKRWYNASPLRKRGIKLHRKMQRALRIGDALDLNISTVGMGPSGLLGYATFPGNYRRFPKLDGVVLLSGSLPGGNANFGPGQVYNKGDTATHEIGHWLNLYHTFQGSCSRLNDYVTDTPAQVDGPNVFVCNPRLDTCRPHGKRSRDPVRNFMNYTDDRCLNQFTWGQRDRMNSAWYIRKVLAR